MKIQIGPDRHGDVYTVIDPPTSWTLHDQVGFCSQCERQLHLVFASPPLSGVATCGCEEIGQRKLIRTAEAAITE
jgi:hypothetical protein